MKHTDVKIYVIREILDESNIFLSKIGNVDNLTDMLTKMISKLSSNITGT